MFQQLDNLGLEAIQQLKQLRRRLGMALPRQVSILDPDTDIGGEQAVKMKQPPKK